MNIAIIGTAGRKDDAIKLSSAVWERMVEHAASILFPIKDPIHLISGGAAWADHLAVTLYLEGLAANLTLHLPSNFTNGNFTGNEDARVANYYHERFSTTLGKSSFNELQTAIEHGATVTVSDGFKSRNALVAKNLDMVLAYTFGTKSIEGSAPINHLTAGLKDGGTAHTWNLINTGQMLHKDLHELLIS